MQTPILFPFCCGIVFIVREEAQTYTGTFPFLCNPSLRCDLNMSSLARPQKLYEPDAPIPFNHCGATFSQITQAKRNQGAWLRVPSSLYSDNHETPNELPVISGYWPFPGKALWLIISGQVISALFDAHPLSLSIAGLSVDSATGESNRLVVWASHWLVVLCPFYRQSLSLVYTCFFPCETCAPSSPGNYWQNILAKFCPGYWFSDSSHMIKSKFSGGITVDISLLPPLIFETYMSPLWWKRTQRSYTLL